MLTRAAANKASAKNSKSYEPIVGGWDVLPHGLGKKGDLGGQKAVDHQSLAGLSPPAKKIARKTQAATLEPSPTGENVDRIHPKLSRNFAPNKEGGKANDGAGVKAKKQPDPRVKAVVDKLQDLVESKPAPRTKKVLDATQAVIKKKKIHPYGLTPGISPFPSHVMPTPEACEEVNRLLSMKHGDVIPPEKIPPPSMDVTGCGEVPDLLDALLRTLLSAATQASNSNLSLQGLKERFGLRTSGVGKGSINWEEVYKADIATIKRAIERGGLATAKAKNIRRILDAVYEQNCARRDALVKETETCEPDQVKLETLEAMEMETIRAEKSMLSMDHVFEMTTDEAMDEMLKLPGIGVKTASCVILFCMQRPSFAVDTHVWRHCKMLGWVPADATRDKTFSHCEVRVPDHLKYSLHQLFLRHGRTCGRCMAKGSAVQRAAAECPIEHLVTRLPRKAAGKKRKRGEDDEDDEGDEVDED